MSPSSLKSWGKVMTCLGILIFIFTQVTSASTPSGAFTLPITGAPLMQRASGQQISSGYADNSWLIPVSIGTPPQQFYFLTDSGAPGFSVASVLLPESMQPAGPKYDPSKSSTSKQLENYTYALAFVSGDASRGVVYQDVVTIANLTVGDMDIEVQTSNNHDSSNASSIRTGNLGLNFDQNGQTTKPDKVPTWLQRIMPTLKSAVFTVNYNASTSNGTFEFGSIDENKYTGSISYAAVNQSFGGGWTIPISGQQLSNGTFVPSDDWFVIVDTGTAGSRITRSSADAYFSQVQDAEFNKGKGEYAFPCSSALPDFTFGLGTERVSIPGKNLNSGSFDGGKTCTSKLNVGDGDGPYLWGQSFIQEFFMVFDWGGARVGFSKKSDSSDGGRGGSGATPTTMGGGQTPTGSGQPSASTSAKGVASSRFSTSWTGGIYGVVGSVIMVMFHI